MKKHILIQNSNAFRSSLFCSSSTGIRIQTEPGLSRIPLPKLGYGAILPPLSRLEQEHRLSRLLSVFKTLPLPIRVIVALIGVTGFEPAAS